jgi:hypothetical protein
MTFSQILADVYRRTGFSSSPASDVSTRIKAFVNEVQQDILSEPGMEFLLNDLVTFASVANQQQYGLPVEVTKIKLLWDTTSMLVLSPMSVGEYRQLYPNPASVTGTPRRYVDLGFDAVSVEPSDASTLYVLSSSASDTGTAYIEGIRSGGYPFSDSVVMTGATAVATTYTDIISVTKFYLSTAAVGTVTLREDSGTGTTLATLAIGQTYARYHRIALAPTPSAVITYSVECERLVTDMAQDTDEPVLPPQFHRLLAIGARAKEYEKQNQIQRWQVARGEFQEELKKLKFWIYNQTIGTPNMRGSSYKRDVLGDGGSIAVSGGSSSTPLAATSGGTGFASYTIGDLLYADTATSLAKLSDVAVGKVLKSGGVGVAPSWSTIAESELSFTDITTGNVTSTKHGFTPKTPSDATQFLNGAATAAWAAVKDSDLSTSDVTTNNVVSTKHGFVPKSPAAATQFLNGAATPAWAQVKDSDLSTSDITTNDVTTAKHGFIVKAPADTAKAFIGDASWGVVFGQICQGRLTLTSGTPVTTADVTGATSVYFTPYGGNRVGLYTSSQWKLYTFTEVTLALGTLTNDLPYDVFLYDSSGTLTLEAVAWTSKTARATALTTQDGVLVKTGSTNKRYLGTFHTTATTTTEDSFAKRLLWNYYNRVPRALRRLESTGSWNYTTLTWRQANSSTSNQVAVVIGVAESPVSLRLAVPCSNGTGGTAIYGFVAIGENSTSAPHASCSILPGTNSGAGAFASGGASSQLDVYPAIGYSFYAWLEQATAGTGTTTFYGTNANTGTSSFTGAVLA